MARPPELVKVMAKSIGMPEATVQLYDRNLRASGLRSKHGRGRGAANVTPRDAATLLTAVLASPLVMDAVVSVERYQAARPSAVTSTGGEFAGLGILELASLSADHSFVDALAAVIAAIASGSYRAALRLPREDADRPLSEVAAIIEVRASTPATVGEIRLAGVRGRTAAILYTLPDEASSEGERIKAGTDALPALVRRTTAHGLRQVRWADTTELVPIGELFNNERSKP